MKDVAEKKVTQGGGAGSWIDERVSPGRAGRWTTCHLSLSLPSSTPYHS